MLFIFSLILTLSLLYVINGTSIKKRDLGRVSFTFKK